MTSVTPAREPKRGKSNESTRTVWVALAAGLGVAAAKAVAAVVTGSPALAAEASHSIADSTNDFFLLLAQMRSRRERDERHPFGYGREAYFWALIAALGVFVAGAAFALREGIAELVHPTATTSFTVAYVVLGVSTVFDLVSFRQSASQMILGARNAKQGILDYAATTSDPSLRAVFNEDAVSIGGDVLAIAGLGIGQVLESSVPQAVAAVLIALVLLRISLRLVKRNHDFLLGQPVQTSDEERVRSFLLAYPGVTAIRELLVTFVGPGQVWVLARIDIARDLDSEQVTALVTGVEDSMEKESENVYRVDIVPVGNGDCLPK